MFSNVLPGKKTYLVALSAIGYAVFAYISGNIEVAQMAQLIETALLGGTLRSALSK
jgi:hypothetical protein